MTNTMKNVLSYGIAILVVGLITFLVTYYLVGLSLGDAIFWAIFLPFTEFAARGLVRLYLIAKNRIKNKISN